jgi:hypothetical protein
MINFFQVELGRETAAPAAIKVEKSQKKWSLDEEDDSEDETSHPPSEVAVKLEKGVKEEGVKEIALPPVKKEEVKEEADDELDPLDAYMTEVSKEVRKIKGASFRAAKGIVTTATAAATAKAVKGVEEKEVKNGVNGGGEGGEKKGLVIMMGVAKKKPELNIKKPEVRI